MPRGVKKDPAARPAIERGIPEKLVNALLDVLGCDEDELTLDSKLVDDLGADSLDVVELGMHCEEEFLQRGVQVDDEMTDRWGHGGTVAIVLADLRALGAQL